MPNEIQIGPVEGSFDRGARLRIPITVHVEKPIKCRGIRATFRGYEETQAEYTTTSTDSDGKSKTEHHTAVEQHDYVREDFLLAGSESLGCFGNIKDGLASLFGAGNYESLVIGEHPFEVMIQLPQDLPATHSGKKSKIVYELTAEVDIPLGRDLRAQLDFPLAARPTAETPPTPVRVRYPEGDKRGLIDSMFGSDVQLEVALTADKYRVGDVLNGMIVAEVGKPVTCRSLTARLVAVESTEARGHSDSHTHQEEAIEIAQPGEVQDQFSERFSLPVQVSGPLTARGERFSVDWFLQLEIDVPWSKDPTIRVPIEVLP